MRPVVVEFGDRDEIASEEKSVSYVRLESVMDNEEIPDLLSEASVSISTLYQLFNLCRVRVTQERYFGLCKDERVIDVV